MPDARHAPIICYERCMEAALAAHREETMAPQAFRIAALASLALTGSMLAALSATAQTAWPSQTVKLVITNPAGGLPDTVARIVGKRLQEKLGQSVVVENRPGANGTVAVQAMFNSAADGYTLVVTDGAIYTSNPVLYVTMPYNLADLLPVAMLARAPLFLAVHPKMQVSTLAEYIAKVKANPGTFNFGSSGVGSTHHLSMEAMNAALKLEMKHVPFKGTGESVPALLGGHIEALMSAYPSLSGAAGGNQVKLLAANSLQRSAQAPELPAISELIPGFDFAPLIGFYGRTGTPAPVLDKIGTEVIAVMKEAEIVKALAVVGVEPAGANSAGFTAALQAEAKRVAEAVQLAGLKPR